MSVKTIFITGASSGFGEACARSFASEGARLILTARRKEKLEALRDELTEAAGVHIIQLDVRDRAAVDAAVASLPEVFRDIDVLVNNAGLALGLEPSHKVAIEDWDVMVDTNVKGLMYCTRAILPGMVERNRGHIVNISSDGIAVRYYGNFPLSEKWTTHIIHSNSCHIIEDLSVKIAWKNIPELITSQCYTTQHVGLFFKNITNSQRFEIENLVNGYTDNLKLFVS